MGFSCMSILELLLLAVGLAMDAFAVSICKGLALERVTLKHAAIVGAWFGVFQALMPTIGYFLGSTFEQYITAFDHWIAFALLALIGGNMIREALHPEEDGADASLGFRTMLMLAIATRIDALAVGVTFACLQVNLLASVLMIGIITFGISMAGVKLGSIFGNRYQARAELAGGVILILLGFKILLEHLGVISF